MSSEDIELTNFVEQIDRELSTEPKNKQNIKKLLSTSKWRLLAKPIIESAKKATESVNADDEELLEALINALNTGLQAPPKHVANRAKSDFNKNLKAIAEGTSTYWLVMLPIEADIKQDLVDYISTANSLRVAISPCTSENELRAKLTKACQTLEIPFTLDLTELPNASLDQLSPAFLLIYTPGLAEAALTYAKEQTHICRDAFRFAQHVNRKVSGLGPLWATTVSSSVKDVFMFRKNRKAEKKIIRREDFKLDGLDVLNDRKARKLYDIAARLLEDYPESVDPNKQEGFPWRLVRSIRTFSRAVAECNQDVRFLLLLVAFEALVNRKEAPIVEAFAEYGALVVAEKFNERFELATNLKLAYNARSRFVHDGKVPSDVLKANLVKSETLVFQTWADLMLKFLQLADAEIKENEFFDGLLKMKFGATWEQAFPMTKN